MKPPLESSQLRSKLVSAGCEPEKPAAWLGTLPRPYDGARVHSESGLATYLRKDQGALIWDRRARTLPANVCRARACAAAHLSTSAAKFMFEARSRATAAT